MCVKYGSDLPCAFVLKKNDAGQDFNKLHDRIFEYENIPRFSIHYVTDLLLDNRSRDGVAE